jgi:type IV pilus assembly protein PilA
MKSTFTAKYLQHLVHKHKDNEGFTLIELLVVIIIVGVLAAIALPSFLNQIGKARGSEAKSNLGTITRGLQAYRLENATMTNVLTNLDAKVTSGFYQYNLSGAGQNAATVNTTTTQSDLKSYSARVNQNGDTFEAIICESQDTVANATASTAPASATNCGGTLKEVR